MVHVCMRYTYKWLVCVQCKRPLPCFDRQFQAHGRLFERTQYCVPTAPSLLLCVGLSSDADDTAVKEGGTIEETAPLPHVLPGLEETKAQDSSPKAALFVKIDTSVLQVYLLVCTAVLWH